VVAESYHGCGRETEKTLKKREASGDEVVTVAKRLENRARWGGRFPSGRSNEEGGERRSKKGRRGKSFIGETVKDKGVPSSTMDI